MDIHEIGDFLEKVADLSQSVYWLSSPDLSKIIYISPAYETIWGRSRQVLYDNPEEWITYLHPDDFKGHHPLHELAERIKSQGPLARYNENYRIIRPDGEIRYILDRGFPIYVDGICQGVTGFATDITENKLAEDEFKKVKHQLKGAQLVSASIAHEIRTPLATTKASISVVKNTIDIICDEIEKNEIIIPNINEKKLSKLKRHINLINKKTDQCNSVINMLLAKLQSFELEASDFDYFFAVNCIEKSLNEFIMPENLINKIKIIKTNDFKILGNQTMIKHIIMNFLKNAIYFIQKANKGEIIIWLENKLKTNEIHFKDTASGITEEVLPHIFKPFFTTETSTGTGVGLAFSKMVMESHQGNITCLSKEGEYTEFILSFPKPNVTDY